MTSNLTDASELQSQNRKLLNPEENGRDFANITTDHHNNQKSHENGITSGGNTSKFKRQSTLFPEGSPSKAELQRSNTNFIGLRQDQNEAHGGLQNKAKLSLQVSSGEEIETQKIHLYDNRSYVFTQMSDAVEGGSLQTTNDRQIKLQRTSWQINTRQRKVQSSNVNFCQHEMLLTDEAGNGTPEERTSKSNTDTSFSL